MNELPFDMDIAVQCESWTRQLSDLEALAVAAISQTLAGLDSPKLGELSLAFVGDADIQNLNRDYRHKDKPTQMFSHFPMMGLRLYWATLYWRLRR